MSKKNLEKSLVQKPVQINNYQNVCKPGINNNSNNKTTRSFNNVPLDAVEFAIDQIREYVDFRNNNDIDKTEENLVSEEQWSKFYEWFYAACQYD